MSGTPDSLVVDQVTRDYPTAGEPLRVLRGVSLRMTPGDRVAVVGPSGSGKSTLLNILGTLDRPTTGSVRLGATDPFALGARELAAFRASRIGFVFQEHHLLGQCTALENVLLAPLARGRVDDAARNRAAALLERVGLTDRAGHLPSELSGGERQRVAIVRALMNEPSLLLADEPTGNLDAQSGRRVGDLFLELARESGAILVVVTHSAALAEQVGRSLRLEGGVLTDGTQ
ncbi:MAG: Lipoprotein-releasing system ATP-binding protein LolD [Phycisphaerae bacterium]|nr:Lipoprotein-releasing system ATP-binding protein LolD [Phycisphaerae bacterium]